MIELLFEPPDARCTKNIRRFLFFSWLGYHKLKIVDVEHWGPVSWNEYEVQMECVLCGARLRRFGISHSEMLQIGIDPRDYLRGEA